MSPVHWAEVVAAVSGAVGAFLRPRLKQLEHLAKDTDDVQRILRSLGRLPTRHLYLHKLDVKDFYMRGSHEAITSSVAQFIADESGRAKICSVIQDLLCRQYVAAHSPGPQRVRHGM